MLRLVTRVSPRILQRSMSSLSTQIPEGQIDQAKKDVLYPKLGNRDIVGYGINGQPIYIDDEMYPMPAVRWAENTPEVMALREKEKGDWKNLTLEEKKALYRANFRLTFAEMNAPTGDWKRITSGVLLLLTASAWVMWWLKQYVYPPVPYSWSDEHREGNIKTMIKQRQNPITGIASKYDYENNKWK